MKKECFNLKKEPKLEDSGNSQPIPLAKKKKNEKVYSRQNMKGVGGHLKRLPR
jgi:hypothetical protein